MKRLLSPLRLSILLSFMVVVLAIYIVALYDMQVVHGATWSAYAENHRLVTRTVEATRGQILDRNEAVLISNRSVNNIVLDWITLQNSPFNNNEVLLDLVELAQSKGYDPVDTLPISGSPFAYTPMSSSQAFHLNAYIRHFEPGIRNTIRTLREAEPEPELEAGAEPTPTPEPEALSIENVSAVELMAFMRSRYNISAELTAEQTRTIAGIRFEIEMRTIVGMDEYVFVRDVGVELISAIVERNFPGVGIQESASRRYNTTVAAHILGRVGPMTEEDLERFPDFPPDAIVGREGLERDFEEFLHGVNGRVRQTVTAAGTVIGEQVIREPQPGGHVVTTLDSGLQAVTETALRSTVRQINANRDPEETQALGASAVAIDPRNGEILALASFPTFPIDRYIELFDLLQADTVNAPLLNRATGGTYSPGSTFKMVTALAGLYYGVIEEYSPIICTGIFMQFEEAGWTPTCMGVHGAIELREAIAVSCNVYFYYVAHWLGLERMDEFTERFGLGSLTGIGFGEASGQRSTREVMSALNVALGGTANVYDGPVVQIGIGQGASLFTPIQLANYTATLANGGVRFQPTLLREVRSYDNTHIIYVQEPVIVEDMRHLPGMDEGFFQAIQEGMYLTTTSGTAQSQMAGVTIPVASKTGTVELRTGISDATFAHGVFVAYAPVENPEIAIAVVVEHGGAGSAAIPVARAMIEHFFQTDTVSRRIMPENRLLF